MHRRDETSGGFGLRFYAPRPGQCPAGLPGMRYSQLLSAQKIPDIPSSGCTDSFCLDIQPLQVFLVIRHRERCFPLIGLLWWKLLGWW